ncbi:transcriptional regulator, LysR family [Sphingobium chlorophenolicum L-1]|uniref:Transcriptional regulator, LysR family n=1 Tax=Sphingobium chlorophenolicum L-1 TaxID=690566 RepID=F6F1Q9_SPHCR|nr:LysR substrate-binding domain-containing protein [Sphingobium chlorophenolicum]AEG51475.1 transcriptional regulator, LysR family [Sphingobium chlorophenolicum L-1]
MIWSLNLRHLRSAAAIARLGSISAAAQTVGITQPAITQGIARLEEQLHTPLFVRGPAGMTATPAMILLAPRMEAALGHINSSRVTMAQMRALIALADGGGYPGASTLSGLAQTTLHRAVRDLSLALRRILVDRRGRSIVFTEAGRRTLRSFRLACAELVAGLGDLAALNGRETGRIAVGAMPLSRARLLPAAINAFRKLRPDAQVSVVEGSFTELVDPLRDGEIDCMLGALRSPPPGENLIQTPLFEDRPVVIGRNGHPLTGSAPDLAQLARYDWIVPPPGTPLRILWDRMFQAANIASPRVPVECGSVMTIRELLLDSDALTLLSRDQLSVELEAGWLSVIAQAPKQVTRTIGLTVRADWRPTAMQAVFLDAIRQTVSIP